MTTQNSSSYAQKDRYTFRYSLTVREGLSLPAKKKNSVKQNIWDIIKNAENLRI